MTVVATTVGAVLALGAQERADLPAPRPHPDAPTRVTAALQPVVPAQRDDRPSRIGGLPVQVTGRSIAGAHASGFASVRALDVVAATQPQRGIVSENLFTA